LVWDPEYGWIEIEKPTPQEAPKQQYQSPPQTPPAPPPPSTNSILINVASFQEMVDYPINKDGIPIIGVDETNNMIYYKWIHIGDGRWRLNKFVEFVEQPITQEDEVKGPDKIDVIVTNLSTLNEELTQLRQNYAQMVAINENILKQLEEEKDARLRADKGNNKISGKSAGTMGSGEAIRND